MSKPEQGISLVDNLTNNDHKLAALNVFRLEWVCRLWWLPPVVWLMNQSAHYVYHGVKLGGDTGRYLSAGASILEGKLPSGKALSYLGYDVFVAGVMGLGGGVREIVFLQILIAGIALWAFYHLGKHLFSAEAAVISTLLVALYPKFAYWNLLVLTESLYISCLIITLWMVSVARGRWHWFGVALFVLFTVSIRPHGVGLLVAFGLVGMIWLIRIKAFRTLALIGLVMVVSASVLWQQLGTMTKHENLIHHYEYGTVIWGDEQSRVLEPPSRVFEGQDVYPSHPVAAVGWYLWQNPIRFLKLATLKVGYLFSHLRTYYSDLHNLFTMVYLYPCYLFMLIGFVGVRSSQPGLIQLSGWIILCQTGIVSLTFADWDGRHLLPLLPIVFLMAGAGFWDLLTRWMDRLSGSEKSKANRPPAPCLAR